MNMKHLIKYESWKGLSNIPDSIDKQYLEDIFLPLTQLKIQFNISFVPISRGRMILITLGSVLDPVYNKVSDVIDVLGSANNYLNECGFILKSLKLYDEVNDRKFYDSISDLEQNNGNYCDIEIQYYPDLETFGVYK